MVPLSTTSAAMLLVNGGYALRLRLRRALENCGYQVTEPCGPRRFARNALGKKGLPLMIVTERTRQGAPQLSNAGAAEIGENNDGVFHYGPLSVDFGSRVVKVEGRPVKLTVKEYSFLRLLLERVGKVVPSSEIVRKIWGGTLSAKSSCLRVYACSLREKLRSPTLPTLLVTEPGVGYRLAFPI